MQSVTNSLHQWVVVKLRNSHVTMNCLATGSVSTRPIPKWAWNIFILEKWRYLGVGKFIYWCHFQCAHSIISAKYQHNTSLRNIQSIENIHQQTITDRLTTDNYDERKCVRVCDHVEKCNYSVVYVGLQRECCSEIIDAFDHYRYKLQK